MKNKVITISREFGSGGRTIGKDVAARLNIPCYDRDILDEIARESGFARDYVQEAGEYAPGGFLSSAFAHQNTRCTNADYLWKLQYNLIVELAQKSPCVIVGRCADYILRDKDKRRAAYHRFYTDMKWGHAQNYDLTLNSGTLGLEECVRVICDVYQKKDAK